MVGRTRQARMRSSEPSSTARKYTWLSSEPLLRARRTRPVTRSTRNRSATARRRGSDDNHVYFLAVDDGSEDRIRAWRVRPSIYVRTYEGDRVTATVTRGLGYVRSIEPAPVPVSVPPAGAGFTP